MKVNPTVKAAILSAILTPIATKLIERGEQWLKDRNADKKQAKEVTPRERELNIL